ncbi:MAG: YraN family protein [Ostreibacterium sp.]
MSFLRKINRKAIGDKAEAKAFSYLKAQGLKPITRNYHTRFGEIDLIMRDYQTVVFIEVRCREKNAQVNAAESVSAKKIQKIRKTAKHYLVQFDEIPDCRFDVIAMTHDFDSSGYTINWITNAF